MLAVAREIETKDLWRGYLTIQEHRVVSKVLENEAMWENLVTGKLSIFVDNPLPDPPLGFRQEQENAANNIEAGARPETPTPSTPVISTSSSSTHLHLKHLQMGQPSPTPSNEGFQKTVSLDCVALAFKVRHMIFDKSVPLLFPNLKGGDLELDIEDMLADKTKEEAPQAKALPVREEEDDYDFDDDDDEAARDDSSKDQQKELTKPAAHMDSVSVEDRPATSEDIQKRDSALLARIWQRYHLFENDNEAMEAYQTQEGNRDSHRGGAEITEEEPTKANFGAANLSLKVRINKV